MTTATADPPATASLAALAARHRLELGGDGYTIVREAMTHRQLAEVREAIDARIQGRIGVDDHPDLYGEANLVAKHAIFRELAQQPLVLAIVEGLLGDDCILSSCNQASRKPGSQSQALHRDTHIWGPSMPWLSVPVGIQVAWCVDDFHAANGATRIVPGSHLRPDASPDEPSIPAEATAGSMILFDARCLHAGGANASQALRRGVLSLYVRCWLKPQTDHKRSIDPAIAASATPALRRLLGFERQSPVERPDGRAEIVPAPGATWFYGETRSHAG